MCVCVCVFFIVCAEFCSNLLHISCSCAKFMMALISLQTARETEENGRNFLQIYKTKRKIQLIFLLVIIPYVICSGFKMGYIKFV